MLLLEGYISNFTCAKYTFSTSNLVILMSTNPSLDKLYHITSIICQLSTTKNEHTHFRYSLYIFCISALLFFINYY
jgi:hypothetical protein